MSTIRENLEVPMDNRLAPRYAMHLPIELLNEDGVHLRAITRNVSATGVFILAEPAPLLNDSLRFLITFPEEITTSCKLRTLCDGVVVRRERMADLQGLAVKIQGYQFL